MLIPLIKKTTEQDIKGEKRAHGDVDNKYFKYICIYSISFCDFSRYLIKSAFL